MLHSKHRFSQADLSYLSLSYIKGNLFSASAVVIYCDTVIMYYTPTRQNDLARFSPSHFVALDRQGSKDKNKKIVSYIFFFFAYSMIPVP